MYRHSAESAERFIDAILGGKARKAVKRTGEGYLEKISRQQSNGFAVLVLLG